MSERVIITCAVTGSSPVNPDHREFPASPAAIAADAIAAARAGAAIAHIHARDPVTGRHSRELAHFQEIVERIRDADVDLIINLTCGGGARFYPDPGDESRAGSGTDVAGVDERIRHIEACRPEMCSLDVSTHNRQRREGDDYVYLNTPRTLRAMAARFKALGVKVELECFQIGDVLLAGQLVAEELSLSPPLFQFVLGVKWTAPADLESMRQMRDQLPEDALWSAFGVGRRQSSMLAAALLLGGHVRTGLEDNLYVRKGEFASNAQLVERAVTQIELLGKTPASPAEARSILGIS